MNQTTRHLLLLVPLALVVFGANIGGYDVWPEDEPRFAQVSREMLRSGDYLVPRINGEVYLEKPPLLFWLTSLVSLPVGDVAEWSARVPSVVSDVIVVVLTYLLAARLFGPRVALWSALILLTCTRVDWQGRRGQIDMLLTACTTTQLYCLWRWELERKTRFLLVLLFASTAGMLAKGPPAIVFPLLYILVFYWGNRPARKQLHWVLGLLLVVALTALWYLPARMAAAEGAEASIESGVAGNLFRNTVGRFFLGVSKAQPPWYYLQTLPMDLMPWTLFLPYSIPWIWRHRRDNQQMRFLLCWVVPALIFFSICIGKRALYLLPIFPALAILLAISVLALMDSERVTWRRRTSYVWVFMLTALGAALLALPATEYAFLFTGGVAVVAAIALFLAGHTLWRARRTPFANLHALMASHVVVLIVLIAAFVLPRVDLIKSARGICEPVRQLAHAGADFDLYSIGFSREEYIYYSDHFHEPLLTGLVGLEEMQEIDLWQVASEQRRARKIAMEAVEEVPVADMTAVTPDERQALLAAIEGAFADDEDAPALIRFEEAVKKELHELALRFNGSEPAFAYVQDEDWRWILPLSDPIPETYVLRHENVGRRYVLLLANDAGRELLLAHP